MQIFLYSERLTPFWNKANWDITLLRGFRLSIKSVSHMVQTLTAEEWNAKNGAQSGIKFK